MTSNRKVPDSGIQLLLKGNEPIGPFFSEINEDGHLEIGPIAVLPRFQGHEFGRLLLRKALRLSLKHKLESALSVNAANEKALSLYLKEGFEKMYSKVCYRLLQLAYEIQDFLCVTLCFNASILPNENPFFVNNERRSLSSQILLTVHLLRLNHVKQLVYLFILIA